jgi:acyl-coenzyme A thioesterase PaaI-like protein
MSTSCFSPSIPKWWVDIHNYCVKADNNALFVTTPEWPSGSDDGCSYRQGNGWQGNDFIHSVNSAVRIIEYVVFDKLNDESNPHVDVDEENMRYILVGLVHYTPAAESHKGYCHGGSMTAVMDDVLGWAGFCCDPDHTDGPVIVPWSGFTVQVDCSLRKPIPVNAMLKVTACVVKKEGRKIFVKGNISDPESNDVHCEAKGLFLKNKEATIKEE